MATCLPAPRRSQRESAEKNLKMQKGIPKKTMCDGLHTFPLQSNGCGLNVSDKNHRRKHRPAKKASVYLARGCCFFTIEISIIFSCRRLGTRSHYFVTIIFSISLLRICHLRPLIGSEHALFFMMWTGEGFAKENRKAEKYTPWNLFVFLKVCFLKEKSLL